MAKLEILTAPHPFLKTKAQPVAAVDDGIRTLMDDMLETMYEANGIGLAAIQVGRPERVVVIDLARGEEQAPQPRFFANPEVVWASEELASYEEGCLSVPEHYAEVDRPARIRLRYLDRDGAAQEEECDGLLATCIQHEIDHLDGVLFIDHLSTLKRGIILRKLKKAQRQAA